MDIHQNQIILVFFKLLKLLDPVLSKVDMVFKDTKLTEQNTLIDRVIFSEENS